MSFYVRGSKLLLLTVLSLVWWLRTVTDLWNSEARLALAGHEDRGGQGQEGPVDVVLSSPAQHDHQVPAGACWDGRLVFGGEGRAGRRGQGLGGGACPGGHGHWGCHQAVQGSVLCGGNCGGGGGEQ